MLRQQRCFFFCFLLMALGVFGAIGDSHAGEVRLEVKRHDPCNVFTPGQKIVFPAVLKSVKGDKAVVGMKVSGYNGADVESREAALDLKANKEGSFTIDLGTLDNGYYEIAFTVKDGAGQEQKIRGGGKVSFAVFPMVSRTAKQVRDEGYRIGMKMYTLNNLWWRGGGDFDEKEALRAICGMGLQWTRNLLQQKGDMPTLELIHDYPMNVIMKVERFPKELYDEKRYGPLKDYEKAKGRGVWTLKTLPKKAEYQAWLRELLNDIPRDQNVFEIWNEAWDKMSPEDLATVSQWIAEVILKDRPDAIIGPNLKGNTSKYEYDALYIKAGGMKGMKMVALHPYAGSEDRAWMRGYIRWLKEQTGRDIKIYVTEYGSHSCPQGPAKRSEEQQARQVVTQTLALYAEDVVAMTPHWLSQREQNPTYHEDWFGYIRLNHEPKPALVALSTAARMIDSGKYMGDLWFGSGVGAMVFEKGGKYTLALWTKEGTKEVEVDTGADAVTLVDIVGREEKKATQGGKLELTASVDIQYIVGISADVAKKASKELRADRWPKPEKPPRNVRKVAKAKKPIVIDGKLDEFKEALQISMVNPKVNGDDASGISYVSWDDDYLYIALDMRDNEVLNNRPRHKLYRQDSIELFVSTEPRDVNPGYGPNDHQFFITPDSIEKKPVVAEVVDREAGKVVDVQGAKFNIGKVAKGWRCEVALPWSAFKGFKPAKGQKMALEFRVNDADESHERWTIDTQDGGRTLPHDPTSWSLLLLE